MIRGWAITLISLGLLYPIHRNRFQEYWVSRTRFGSSRFYYEGTASELFPIWIHGFLLSLISFGVYSFWLRAGLQRYFWSRTRLEQAQLTCNLHGWPLFRESMIYVFFSFSVVASPGPGRMNVTTAFTCPNSDLLRHRIWKQ